MKSELDNESSTVSKKQENREEIKYLMLGKVWLE